MIRVTAGTAQRVCRASVCVVAVAAAPPPPRRRQGINVTLRGPYPPNNITVGARYYLEGSLDGCLDAPGEFYVRV